MMSNMVTFLTVTFTANLMYDQPFMAFYVYAHTLFSYIILHLGFYTACGQFIDVLV